MKNPYLHCAGPLLLTLTALNEPDQNPSDASTWRQRVLEDMEQFSRRAQARDLPGPGVQDARYALTVLVDERAMALTDALAQSWAEEPLQVTLFGEYRGGEGFFERLAELRQHPRDHADLLELYLCCLHLGLEGVYRLRGPERLESLKSDLREQVQKLQESDDDPTTAASLAGKNTRYRSRPVPLSIRGISLTLLGLIPVLVFFQGWQLHTLDRNLSVTLDSHVEAISRALPIQSVRRVLP
ncbi:hypothetical protein M911_00030 [Ectothiorhodospira haloalkaliphila]|uniref:Type IV / VI secretion system DotU domain-containing protein n=1 Tax=Ectothiorhodospira haloalkaliphila TaxID=421628 RepID=W8KL57_9GAMM|nr:type IVB secretion system protein IcmH/DotU [Ectothiorhodospira haloalkaliphila]AHK80529.1 hypothetical protein M911_00030 [Ectothiorhodospira haloalkaliphila]MCG5523841.1 type IVB secretion system protein IcmH/DotU [Ectothiorhodospira haloalkaliphila]